MISTIHHPPSSPSSCPTSPYPIQPSCLIAIYYHVCPESESSIPHCSTSVNRRHSLPVYVASWFPSFITAATDK